MLLSSEHDEPPPRGLLRRIDFRVVASALLLVAAAWCTWLTIQGLDARRRIRTELAEISHARYGLLNADQWVKIMVPIFNKRIDEMDLKASNRASLKPTVENALYRLLEDVKQQMSTKDPKSTDQKSTGGMGGFMVQGNAMMVNMIVSALRPHVPEYADMVLKELGRPENKQAVKNFIKSSLIESARNTFGDVDMRWHSSILQRYGCADATSCQQEMGKRIHEADAKIAKDYLTVLASAVLAFLLVMIGRPVLRRSGTVVLLLFCVVLLAGGVLTPMLEVEAKISRIDMTFLGEPIAFTEQVLYFQSRSVLEVFHTLITTGRLDMWFVGVLVLMFSIVFPTLKVLTLSFCIYKPAWLHRNRIVRFLALESSKWSMADVMALAIFMSFVAFNGLIPNTMAGLRETGAAVTIPTDSSKILPGYYLFVAFCLASLFLSKKLERGIRTRLDLAKPEPAGR